MLRTIPRPLASLLAVSALLSVAWAFTTTPFQGPDEPAHFSYAQYLAEKGKAPSVLVGTRPESMLAGTSLGLFNLDQLAGVHDARPAWTKLEEQRFQEIVTRVGEKGDEDGAGPNPIAKNPPLYYAYEVVPYALGSAGSFWDRLIVMRLASGLLVLLAVVFTWLAAAELFAATWPRVIAAGCVALLPQLTALGATINADAMLVAVWAAFTFVAPSGSPVADRARAVSSRVAGLAAASLLTHGRGIAIVPALVVVLRVALLRGKPSPWRALARWLAPAHRAAGGRARFSTGCCWRRTRAARTAARSA